MSKEDDRRNRELSGLVLGVRSDLAEDQIWREKFVGTMGDILDTYVISQNELND
jgi:hypothetical protein